MASYNTVITNEGAALLASVIANQGTLTLSEMRFSTTDYDGVEQTLTVGTFGGVFITAAAAGSVVDATTIKVAAQFDNSGIVGDHPLYSIGIVGTDGNTTALIAVCTTTNPDIIRAALTGVSTYAFNVNLAVSSTNNITVTGTTAAVLYDIDVVDTLISTATNKPLSANQGRVLADNLAANEESGAKNHADSSTATTQNESNNNGVFTNTVADSYTDFAMYIQAWTGSTFISNLTYQTITATGDYSYNITIPSGTDTLQIIHNGGNYDLRAKFNCDVEGDYIISFRVLGANPSEIGGLSFDKVMLYDARIIDPTFVPYAKTNKQLTNDKAERKDLTTIFATGTTNTTGAQINAGTFFYLNDQFCKAITDIAANATFTENTNYKKDTVGGEIEPVVIFKYGITRNLSATIKGEIENSFTNAANYSIFSGSTSEDTEGGWYGFKHTSSKFCHMIFFDRAGIYAITRAADGTYTKNVIFENN